MSLQLSPSPSDISKAVHPPELAIIYAGGTFGCIGEPLAPMPAADFLPKLDQLVSDKFALRCHSLPTAHIRDSSQLQASDWIELVAQIIHLQQQGIQRILLIHGTDTLAYTSAFLAEVLAGWPLRLVITGSQYPLLDRHGQQAHPSSDALANLTLAIQQVQHTSNGVFVAFAGEYWPAHQVQKVHTTDLQAFSGACLPASTQAAQAPNAAIAPAALAGSLHYLKQLNISTYYALPLDWSQQALQLRQLLDSPALDALILLGFGTGNIAHSAEIEKLFGQAASRGIMLVISTQVPFGGVDSRYAAGHWLSALNVLSAGQLPVPAIYARLAWICCQTMHYHQRRQYWLQGMKH